MKLWRRSDLSQALRSLRAHPGPVATIIAVASLGIGLTGVMFALCDPFLFRPLPYDRPDELVALLKFGPRMQVPTAPSQIEYLALSERTDLFIAVAAWHSGEPMRIQSTNGPFLVRPAFATETLFDVLGTRYPRLSDWSAAGTQDIPVVLTARTSQRLFGEANDPVGKILSCHGQRNLRVVAVLPEEFAFPSERTRLPEVILPIDAVSDAQRNKGLLGVLARVRSGWSASSISAALPASTQDGERLFAESLSDRLRKRLRPLAVGALAAALLLFLVCTANAGNLLLVRGIHRAREFATRKALGATASQLLGLSLVELGIVYGFASLLGLLFVQLMLSWASQFIPEEYLALGSPHLDARLATFALGAGLAMLGLVAVPAHMAAWSSEAHLATTLSSESRLMRVTRSFLAATQSGVTAILLVGMALLVRSHEKLLAVDSGFADDTIIVTVSYPSERSPAVHRVNILDTIELLRRVPGITAVGASVGTLFDAWTINGAILVPGREADRDVAFKFVSCDYFAAMGTAVLAGETFAEADEARSDVVIVNEALARRYWPGRSAVGQAIQVGPVVRQVKGVVQSTHDLALDVEPRATVFLPLGEPLAMAPVQYSVRSLNADASLAAMAKRSIQRLDSDAIVAEGATIGSRLSDTISDRWFATAMLGVFTCGATAVCGTGLFGLVAFVVARRTREIAIRIALGANPGNVCILVIRETAVATICGALIGFLVSMWLSRLLVSLLYGIRPSDPAAMLGAVTTMAFVVALAAWLPARRAVHLSPVTALRTE